MEVGCVVENVGTVATIGSIIKTGMPLIQRVVTVSGSAVQNPKNLYVRIGTTFKDVIEQCGGYKEEPTRRSSDLIFRNHQIAFCAEGVSMHALYSLCHTKSAGTQFRKTLMMLMNIMR